MNAGYGREVEEEGLVREEDDHVIDDSDRRDTKSRQTSKTRHNGGFQIQTY